MQNRQGWMLTLILVPYSCANNTLKTQLKTSWHCVVCPSKHNPSLPLLLLLAWTAKPSQVDAGFLALSPKWRTLPAVNHLPFIIHPFRNPNLSSPVLCTSWVHNTSLITKDDKWIKGCMFVKPKWTMRKTFCFPNTVHIGLYHLWCSTKAFYVRKHYSPLPLIHFLYYDRK